MEPELEPTQLNPREIEILSLIAEGLSNREIAQKLYLSQETVKWYNKQLFAKLGAASRTQAVSIAKKRRLLQTMQIPAPAPSQQVDQGRYKLGPELGGKVGVRSAEASNEQAERSKKRIIQKAIFFTGFPMVRSQQLRI
jgi:DNA-binding CsgD family transcriptional regulator